MDNQTSSHPSGRANIGATVVLVVAVAAAAAPFLLSDEFISARLFAGSNNSPEMRLYATQLAQIDKHIADLKSETKTLDDDIYRSSKGCEASVVSAFEAHVVMNPEPKCNPATEGNSDNPNLNKTQLLDANTAIRHLRDVKTKSGINQEDTRNAISDRASVQMRYNKASATAAMAQVAQGQWSLILLRYGSFGAIGAIGFNAILRMGVYVSASGRRRSTGSEMVFYLVGCMWVAAILAVILVPRLVEIMDKNGNYALTPQGVSVALAAGLVGDVALRAVKKVFGEARG